MGIFRAGFMNSWWPLAEEGMIDREWLKAHDYRVR